MWPAGDGVGWWMLSGGLMMVLFWGAIIALAVWVVRTLTRRDAGETEPRQSRMPRLNPLDIANGGVDNPQRLVPYNRITVAKDSASGRTLDMRT